LVLAVAGCGGDTKSLTEDQFCTEWAERECGQVAAKCVIKEGDCQPVRKKVCQDFAAAAKATSTARKYVAGNTSTCLSRLNAIYGSSQIDPDDWSSMREACQRVFQGEAKADDKCTIDYDCEGTLICDKGRCAKKNTQNMTNCSNPGFLCSTGKYCKRDGDTFICEARIAQGIACSAAEPCLESLRCDGTCQPELDDGAKCTSDADCKSNFCSPFTGVCLKFVTFAMGSSSCNAFTSSSSTPDAGTSADTAASSDTSGGGG
jgi:hypothetical protein